MPFDDGDVVVRYDEGKWWKLEEPITYRGNKDVFTVPHQFRTDFASVPRPFVWLLPPYGAYTKAAILHDYLCKPEAEVRRADADGLFRRAMWELGVPFIRRWMMWAAVRLASFLRGARPGQVAIWVLVAIPSLAFVLIPGLLILVWLFLFWVIELLAYAVLHPKSDRRVNKPALNVTAA
jgi:hypothetical protein